MAKLSRSTANVFARLLPADERAEYIAAVAPARNGNRVAGGHAADERGRRWERFVADHHRVAAAEGIARMRKVGAPVIIGAGGTPTGWAGSGPADYQGFVRAGGAWWRPCAVEAKSREGRLQRDDIDAHQRRDLDLVDSVGGLALVLVELTDDGDPIGAWAVPWNVLDTLWKVTRRVKPGRAGSALPADYITSRSVGASDLSGWEVQGDCYLRRWVEPARAE